jgi:predicted ATP-dependent protease
MKQLREIKATQALVKLQRIVEAEIENKIESSPNQKQLADLRNYFLLRTIRIAKRPEEEQMKHIEGLMRQEYYCEAEKDLFDAGFFFALGQFLSLSRRCKRGEGDKIEEQILQTSKELDL